MMKLRREARTLKQKALSSLRRGLSAFNSYDDDGRITTVLLHAQHACEMLLKAALIQRRISIFDGAGRSCGFEKCINLARAHCGLADGEAGIMRTIDSLRDAEQHWMLVAEQDVLYLHLRGLVTAFDEVLKRVFDDDLTSHLAVRVLPISAEPLVMSISSSIASFGRLLNCSLLAGGPGTRRVAEYALCWRWSRTLLMK
jgi:hypothetical protein